MKVLQKAVALVPVVVMVGLGCGGADGNPGPSVNKCVIKVNQLAAKPKLKDIDCEAVSNECCAVVNADVKIGSSGRGGMMGALASVGKCGRNDQVGLFTCFKAAAASEMKKELPPGLKLCTTAPAVGEGTDGDGTCKITARGQGFSLPGVSTGCCTAINNAGAATLQATAKQGKPSLKTQQNSIDAVCGLIGVCGRKDQEGIVKFGDKIDNNGIVGFMVFWREAFDQEGHGQEMMALLEYLRLPPIEGFLETEALDEEQSVTEYQSGVMAAIGFVAGAAFTGLGLVALNRRKPTPLEEPLT